MNAKLKGNNTLVWSVARQYLLTFCSIALVTIFVYVILATILGSEGPNASSLIQTIFIQTIWGVCIFAALPYVTSFKFAIGFGSTRIAYWRTYIKFAYLIICLNTLFLLVASALVIFIYSLFPLVQDVTVFSLDTAFFLFAFLMLNSFLFGATFLTTVFWFQQGFFKTLVIFIALGVLITIAALTNIIPKVIEFHLLPLTIGAGIVGFIFVFIAYSLAKNGTLTYMNR